MTVLVGAVGQLYQGDLDFGRVVVEGIGALGPGVAVAQLDYGAVAVAQDLEDMRPDALILVGAAQRGRAPGTLELRSFAAERATAAEAGRAIAEAVTGYVTLDLVLEVGSALGVLPAQVVTIELEPVRIGPSDELSPPAAEALDSARRLIRAEVRQALRRPRERPGRAAEPPPAARPPSRPPGLRP